MCCSIFSVAHTLDSEAHSKYDKVDLELTPVADAGSITLTCILADTIILDGSNSSIGPEFEYLWTNSNGDTISTEIIATVFEMDAYVLTVTNTLTGETASDIVDFLEARDIAIMSLFSEGPLTCSADTINTLLLTAKSEKACVTSFEPLDFLAYTI